jgi:hypothetical protein
MKMPWDNFTPLSQEDIDREYEDRLKDMLLEEGRYEIKVIKCVERKSASGNDMFELTIELVNPKGKNKNVFEYILHDQKWIHKLKKVCDCLGMQEKYNTGQISCEDFELKTGKADVERFNDKKWGWKNKISNYIPSDFVEEVSDEDLNEDIPF